MVPLAHTAWLRLVATGYRGKEAYLPGLDEVSGPIEYLTQSAHIGEVRLPRAAGEEAAPRLLSVVQSADAYEGDATVQASDRRQVLDGVVRYGDQLAVVIESKLDELVDDRQVREINVGDSGWEVDRHFVAVAWREVIESWRRLLDRELLGHAEGDILRDFLLRPASLPPSSALFEPLLVPRQRGVGRPAPRGPVRLKPFPRIRDDEGAPPHPPRTERANSSVRVSGADCRCRSKGRPGAVAGGHAGPITVPLRKRDCRTEAG